MTRIIYRVRYYDLRFFYGRINTYSQLQSKVLHTFLAAPLVPYLRFFFSASSSSDDFDAALHAKGTR